MMAEIGMKGWGRTLNCRLFRSRAFFFVGTRQWVLSESMTFVVPRLEPNLIVIADSVVLGVATWFASVGGHFFGRALRIFQAKGVVFSGSLFEQILERDCVAFANTNLAPAAIQSQAGMDDNLKIR